MENLNRYIKQKTKAIFDSKYDFESLFAIIHDQDDRIFAEYDDFYQTKELLYRDFKDYCYKAASFLNDNVKGKDYVGLYMENSINWVATFWAILMIGKKPVLLNAKLPDTVNDNIVSLLKITDVVLCKNSATKISVENKIEIEPTIGFCKEYLDAMPYKPGVWGNEIALTTTATSMNYKVCFYTGEDFTHQVSNAKGILECNKIIKKHYKGRLKQLAFLPFYHIFGLVATYFWFAAFGRTFVFLSDYSPNTILTTVKKHNITHIFAVPLLWNTIVREIKKELNSMSEKDKKRAEKGFDLSITLQKIFPSLGLWISRRIFKQIVSKTLGDSICFLISGGGYISDETLRIINAIGYPLHNGYGATEIGITSVELRENVKYRLLGKVGRPFDSIQYKIDDDILYVKGSSTCSRIVEKDGSETIVKHDEWWNTHDVAVCDNTLSYSLKGRSDDVILGENGEKINPDLIEQKILLTNVSDYCVLGVDNVPTLIIHVKENANMLEKKKICTDVEKALAILKENGFSNVKCLYTTDQIISKNAIKVSRKQLLSKIENGSVSLHSFSEIEKIKEKTITEVSSDVTIKIKEMIGEIIGLENEKIGLDDHFIFDLGGTSLDYCSLLIELENEFGSGVIKQGQTTVREFAMTITESFERS